MKKIHCNILLFSLFFLYSCQNVNNQVQTWESSFTDVQKIHSTPLLQEELILGRPFLMHYADSSLLIYDDLADSIFCFIDMANDNKIYRTGRKGQAGNEFLQVFSFCNMPSDSLIGVYDAFRHCLREISTRKIRLGIDEFPIIYKDSISSLKLFYTKYETFLGMGFYEENMLSLSGESIGHKFYFEYPYKDRREKAIPNRLRGMAYQGTWCSNKSLDRFLYVARNAPIICFYEISETDIKKTYEWIGGYPMYRTEETKQWSAAPISADNEMTFISAYATDNFVYLLYSGQTIKDAQMDAFQSNTIYQLRWDGSPVKRYDLDYPTSLFCVSDKDDTIYALADKDELEIVYYRI